jgi:hypothetical protein
MIENCSPDQFAAIAFSGHRGSGKSTELLQLQKALTGSCFSLHLDVNEFLDAADVDYTDLFLLISRRLLDGLRESGVALSENLLDAVEGWFREVTEENEESVKLSAGVATEAKAGVEIPFVARLLAKLTADAKAGSSKKVTTRRKLDDYFSGLLANTNLLLTAASDALHQKKMPARILIVIDNLDRMPPKKSEELFFAHGSQLQEMKCDVLYTLAIETYYSNRNIGIVFPRRALLPNVKLQQAKDSPAPNAEGMEALREVIRRRWDVGALLQPPDLMDDLVRWSGGNIRQMVRLMAEAVLSAQARDLNAIDKKAVQDAATSLQQDFERALTPEAYPLLAKTAVTMDIEKNEAYFMLLQNTAILEYNGDDVWYGVNPLVGPIDAFQAARSQSRAARKTTRRRRV